MMSAASKLCLDANILITARAVHYPPSIFAPLWNKLAKCKDQLIIIEPIWDEINPAKSDLLKWLEDNGFRPTIIDDDD